MIKLWNSDSKFGNPVFLFLGDFGVLAFLPVSSYLNLRNCVACCDDVFASVRGFKTQGWGRMGKAERLQEGREHKQGSTPPKPPKAAEKNIICLLFFQILPAL